MRDTEGATDPLAWTPVRARTLVWTLFAGALVGSCCGIAIAPPMGARFEARVPWTGEAPLVTEARPLRADEGVKLVPVTGGAELVVTAGSASEARTLARDLVGRRAPGPQELASVLTLTRETWRQQVLVGPLPPRTRAAECAARLLARASWSRQLAAALPVPAPVGSTPGATPPGALLNQWDNIESIARSRDVQRLDLALDIAAEHEDHWFANPQPWQGWTLGARAEAWRRWQVACADAAEPMAEQLLASQTSLQRRMVQQLVPEYRLALDQRVSEPWRMFAAADTRSVRPLVRPIVTAWLPPVVVGAGAGVVIALLSMLFGTLLRPALSRVQPMAGAEMLADPAAAGPRLHVVSGATPSAVVRAVLELAARRVAVGERVLLVDGSARLRLHERLGRDARWGLLECLAADMPVLGLVQYAGHPGLYLLPHGNAERAVGWSSLGRKLDEVVPHFGRIVLALDPQSPAWIGDAVRGRAMEGWWAGHDHSAITAADLATARFGIVFHGLDLSALSEPTLEALGERVLALRPPGPAPERAPITARAVPLLPPRRRTPLEPIVLDCDLQVLQRLRFLAWMRQVQAANRHTEVQAST